MTVELSRSYGFEAAHWLPKVPETHKCHHLHGHSYTVTVQLAGPVDHTTGMLMDYDDIDTYVNPVIAHLDHRCLNDIIDNPTVENLAPYIWDELDVGLPLTAVTVAETGRAACIYRGA